MEINTTQDNKNSNQVVKFNEVNLKIGDGFRFGFGFGAGMFIWGLLIMAVFISISILIGGSILNSFSKNLLTNTIQTPKTTESNRIPFLNFK